MADGTPISPEDFEVNAFEILSNAKDYEDGVNRLREAYQNQQFTNPEAVRDIYSNYSFDLGQRFDTHLSEDDVIDIVPVKPSEADGEETLDRINSWEEENLRYLAGTDDPDYLAVRKQLETGIRDFASRARRDELGGAGETGAWAWSRDKFYRFAGGLIGPVANLVGLDELDQALYERTSPDRDDGVAGMVASGLGALVPVVASGPAAPYVMGAQAAGQARHAFEESMERTGDPGRALTSAGITAAANYLPMAPLQKSGSALVATLKSRFAGAAAKQGITEQAEKSLGAKIINSLEAQKETFGNVAINTISAGTAGAAGVVLGNIANNIGLDQNGDITEGAIQGFLGNAILGGVLEGGRALAQNVTIEQAKTKFKEYEKALQEYTAAKSAEAKASGGPVLADTPMEAGLVFKDKDGYWQTDYEAGNTVEARREQDAKFAKAYQDYLNEPPADSIFTSEFGDEVNPPVDTDFETDFAPDKTVLIPDYSSAEGKGQVVTPGQFTIWFSRFLGGDLSLSRNVSDGAFGSYNPASGKIKVLRSLGADPAHFRTTLAHEIGHFIDGYANKAFTRGGLKDIADKLVGLKRVIDVELPHYNLREEAAKLSQDWRPGWDGSPGDPRSSSSRERFNAYRAMPEEIYADVFSALMNAPGYVRDNYPNVMNAFEGGIARDPKLGATWDMVRKFETDPNAASDFTQMVVSQAKLKHGQMELAARLNKIKENHPAVRLEKAAKLAYQAIFDRFDGAKVNARKQGNPAAREAAFDAVLRTQAGQHIYPWLERNYNAPLNNLLKKVLQEGIDPMVWDHYEMMNHIINDATPTMHRIDEDFETYKGAAAYIAREFLKDPRIKPNVLESYFNVAALQDAEALKSAFASIGIIGDTANIYTEQQFVNRYPPNDPHRAKKGLRDYNRAVAALNRRKENIPTLKLRENIEASMEADRLPSKTREAIRDVLTPNAFAARRYLVNASGATLLDAQADLAAMQRKMGPEQFEKLQGFSKEYHEIINRVLPLVRDAQIFRPELLDRIDLNSANYVTTLILKHFEGDDKINGAVRTAIGSFDDAGSALSATYNKMKAIAERSAYQIASNAAVNSAKIGGQIVEQTKSRPDLDLYALRDKLSKSDKDHSYIISTENGRPILNKISDGKTFENMQKNVRDGAVVEPFLYVTDQLSKVLLTRQLKTVFSPAFWISQKFMDRMNETLQANSKEITFGLPFHTNSKLRAMKKEAKAEARKFIKEGIAEGDAKILDELRGVALNRSELDADGVPIELSFADALYEQMGTKMPDEKTLFEKIGGKLEWALGKVGGDYIKELAEIDELATKIMGYKIGREIKGMGPREAAVFARDRFGIPDPLGGGYLSPALNRAFLFGRAHLNGLRTLASYFRDNSKTSIGTQLALRVGMPKLILMSGAMGAVLSATMGEETGTAYQEMLKRIPEFEKMSRFILPLGFYDSKGTFRAWFDVKPGEIGGDWKAAYIRTPQSRELTTITRVMWPTIKNLLDGKPAKALAAGSLGAGTAGMAGVQPALQYLTNLVQITVGANPTDFYRMKGILPQKVVEGASLGRKFFDYSKYMAGNIAPSIVPYNPFVTNDPTSAVETTITKAPIAGPLLRSFLGVSNYGLIESDKAMKEERAAFNAELQLSTGEATQELLTQYARANAQTSSGGKKDERIQKFGEAQELRNHELLSWHSKVWLPMRNELRSAREAGDTLREKDLLDALEKESSAFLRTLDAAEEDPQ